MNEALLWKILMFGVEHLQSFEKQYSAAFADKPMPPWVNKGWGYLQQTDDSLEIAIDGKGYIITIAEVKPDKEVADSATLLEVPEYDIQ